MAKKKTAGSKAVSKSRPKRTASKASSGSIYQVKITLDQVKPPIWRRVQVKDCTLATLHAIIQASMGWYNSHLHEFEIGGERFGQPEQWAEPGGWDEPDVGDSAKVKLSQLVDRGIKKLRYVYDMGDNWQHTIQIEKVVPAESGVKYPRCIAGARACPPEDCGGPWGYPNFLEIIGNPKHPEHEEMVEWSGGEFDPEEFDADETSAALEGIG